MRPDTLSIYVIRTDRAVKIGISIHVKQRLSNLQAANPHDILTLVFHAWGTPQLIRDAERLAHKKLAVHSIRNEWFSTTPEEATRVVIAACNHTFGIEAMP